MNTPHVMLDIETMSTDPGRALVLSIGAVKFGLTLEGPVIGDSFCAVLDPREQFALGRVVDPRTVKWWQDQTKAVRNAWLLPDYVRLSYALNDLAEFIGEAKTVWANGAVFDIGNVESLYRETDRPVPWLYNAVRDLRTIVKVMPALRQSRPEDGAAMVCHDPVADCVNQIHWLYNHAPVVLLEAEAETV